MNSLWNRFKYAIQSDLHTLMDQKEQKNPIGMLNHYIEQAAKQTATVGDLLKRQVRLQEELKKQLAEAEEMAHKRREQLALAQAAGEEDLVVFAEQEVITYEERALCLRESVMEAANELIALEQKFEKMKHQIKDMKMRRLQLMGKENVTRAHYHMNQILTPDIAEKEDMHSYIEQLGGPTSSTQNDRSTMEKRLESLSSS